MREVSTPPPGGSFVSSLYSKPKSIDVHEPLVIGMMQAGVDNHDPILWYDDVIKDTKPAGRAEANLLWDWLVHELERHKLDDSGADPLHSIQSECEVYSLCVQDLVRQVSVHCAERGHLLASAWSRMVETVHYLLRKLRESEHEHEKILSASQNAGRIAQERLGATGKQLHDMVKKEQLLEDRQRWLSAQLQARNAEIMSLRDTIEMLNHENDRLQRVLESQVQLLEDTKVYANKQLSQVRSGRNVQFNVARTAAELNELESAEAIDTLAVSAKSTAFAMVPAIKQIVNQTREHTLAKAYSEMAPGMVEDPVVDPDRNGRRRSSLLRRKTSYIDREMDMGSWTLEEEKNVKEQAQEQHEKLQNATNLPSLDWRSAGEESLRKSNSKSMSGGHFVFGKRMGHLRIPDTMHFEEILQHWDTVSTDLTDRWRELDLQSGFNVSEQAKQSQQLINDLDDLQSQQVVLETQMTQLLDLIGDEADNKDTNETAVALIEGKGKEAGNENGNVPTKSAGTVPNNVVLVARRLKQSQMADAEVQPEASDALSCLFSAELWYFKKEVTLLREPPKQIVVEATTELLAWSIPPYYSYYTVPETLDMLTAPDGMPIVCAEEVATVLLEAFAISVGEKGCASTLKKEDFQSFLHYFFLSHVGSRRWTCRLLEVFCRRVSELRSENPKFCLLAMLINSNFLLGDDSMQFFCYLYQSVVFLKLKRAEELERISRELGSNAKQQSQADPMSHVTGASEPNQPDDYLTVEMLTGFALTVFAMHGPVAQQTIRTEVAQLCKATVGGERSIQTDLFIVYMLEKYLHFREVLLNVVNTAFLELDDRAQDNISLLELNELLRSAHCVPLTMSDVCDVLTACFNVSGNHTVTPFTFVRACLSQGAVPLYDPVDMKGYRSWNEIRMDRQKVTSERELHLFDYLVGDIEYTITHLPIKATQELSEHLEKKVRVGLGLSQQQKWGALRTFVTAISWYSLRRANIYDHDDGPMPAFADFDGYFAKKSGRKTSQSAADANLPSLL